MTPVHPGTPASAAARRAGQALAWARDYAWIVRAQAGALLAPPDPARWADGTRVPVLLLPGIWETWPVLRSLAEALHAAGHPVHVVPALGRNAADVEVGAALVRERLRELALPRVVLVAHSKGGLIGKTVLGDPAVRPSPAGLVAVSTPFAGSRWATWFPVRSVRLLAPGAPGVRALAAQVAAHSRIVALRPRFDPHVPRAADAAPLAGAVEVELPLDGHFRPLGAALLHAAVLDAVAGFADGPATA